MNSKNVALKWTRVGEKNTTPRKTKILVKVKILLHTLHNLESFPYVIV